jgi:hypothetical protein
VGTIRTVAEFTQCEALSEKVPQLIELDSNPVKPHLRPVIMVVTAIQFELFGDQLLDFLLDVLIVIGSQLRHLSISRMCVPLRQCVATLPPTLLRQLLQEFGDLMRSLRST